MITLNCNYLKCNNFKYIPLFAHNTIEDAMRRIFIITTLILMTTLVFAAEYNLIKVPVPDDPRELENTQFQLLHRAGDCWIGIYPANMIIPDSWDNLDDYDMTAGDYFQVFPSDREESEIIQNRLQVISFIGKSLLVQADFATLRELPPLKTQWVRISSTPKSVLYHGVAIDETDQFHPLVNDIVALVDSTQYVEYVQTLQDFITRNTYSNGCLQAADWMRQQLEDMGLEARLDPFLIGGNTRYNVVGELTGQTYPDEIILITGHFDATAGSPWGPEPQAPGADDNGSGAAAALEAARIMSQYTFDYTVQFVGFAGEEQGLYGSEDYVDNLVTAGANVVGCFNYDMIAYAGDDPWPPDLMIYADNNPLSQDMADKLFEAAITFVPTEVEPIIDIDPSVTYSDHSPFWDAGFPAILGIEEEAWGPDFNPWYHSVQDVVSNCDMDYAVACTKAAIAALADYAGPIVTNGPALMASDYLVEELTGNGNGIPDPGESIGITVTLTNVGVETAENITAYLVSYDPNISMTQPFSAYPDLDPQETGTCYTQYTADISASCPVDYPALLQLDIQSDSTYFTSTNLSFVVGDPLYSPVGPDAYGYYAFDILDVNGPVYDWIEVDPAMGGSGTEIPYSIDDETVQVPLPFTFQYYGMGYNELSICNNGWIAMGSTQSTDYSNSHIPNTDGPPAMIAPFWEDLSPQLIGTVCYYYDANEHYFVVEFNGVRQYAPASALETFEVVLYDPAHYQTATGDGMILFQYKELSDPSSCTVGIENQSETVGLEFLYNGSHHENAYPIANETAILFTTVGEYPDVTITLAPVVTPVQIPANGGSFEYNIAAANNEPAPQSFDVWCDITLPGGTSFGPVLGPVSIALAAGVSIDRDRTQIIPLHAPQGNYLYNAYAGVYPTGIWSSDEFTFEKLETEMGVPEYNWDNWGEEFDDPTGSADHIIPAEFALHQAYPNPFNPETVIAFSLPKDARVTLKVYDIQGREIAELADEFISAGYHERRFNGNNLSSGVYFVRMVSADFQQTRKILLVK